MDDRHPVSLRQHPRPVPLPPTQALNAYDSGLHLLDHRPTSAFPTHLGGGDAEVELAERFVGWDVWGFCGWTEQCALAGAVLYEWSSGGALAGL